MTVRTILSVDLPPGQSFLMPTNNGGTILVTTVDAAPVPPSPPPLPPPLPAGIVLQLDINAGRTVTSSVLTQWVDQSASAFVFTVPGGATGFAVTAAQFQAFDGQNNSVDTQELSSAGAQPWADGSQRTIVIAARHDDPSAFGVVLTAGTGGNQQVLCVGSGVFLTTGVTTITGPSLYFGSPFVATWQYTAGVTHLSFWLNGWAVAGLNVSSQILGINTGTDATAGPNVQLCHRDSVPTQLLNGDLEKGYGWTTPSLNASQRQAAEQNAAAGPGPSNGLDRETFVIPVKGYVSDSPCLPFYGLTQFLLARAAYAASVVYTTATTLHIKAQTTLGALVPPQPQCVTIILDGEPFATIPIATTVSPFAPVDYPLTLDGAPHIVEIVDGAQQQAGVGAPEAVVVAEIQDPTGQTQLFPAQIPPNRLTIVGDSIALGFGAPGPLQSAFYPMRFQSQFNGRISFWATAGRSVFTDQSFDATFAATATQVATMSAEVTPGGREIVWVELGVNDWIFATYVDLAHFQTAYAALVDAIHADRPGAAVVLQAPIVALNETVPNASGYTLPNVRAAIAAVASSRPWSTFVDASLPFEGVPPVSLANLIGGLHPNVTGYAQYNAWSAKVISSKFPEVV